MRTACAATQTKARRSDMDQPSWAATMTSNAPSLPVHTKTIITNAVMAWIASDIT
jgi:hypothetical protein